MKINSNDVTDITLPSDDGDATLTADADANKVVVGEKYNHHHQYPKQQQQPSSKFQYIFMFCGLIFVIQLLLSGVIFHHISSSSSSSSSQIISSNNNSTTTTTFLELTSLLRNRRFRQRQRQQQNITHNNAKISISTELSLLQQRLDHLESELSSITKSYSYGGSVNDDDDEFDDDDDDEFDEKKLFVPFMIRDARRLVPNFVKPTLKPTFYKEFHIFDYVDLDGTKYNAQEYTKTSALYHNGRYIGMSPCQKYAIQCYKEKIIQVLDYLLYNMTTSASSITTKSTYYFYMESDNELCVPISQIRDLAFQEQRYFISTGIGFSGWIMRYDFLQDFYNVYNHRHKHGNEGPDPIGATLLMEKKAWSVTRQYLVSHTLTTTQIGSEALTVGRKDTPNSNKHLPRCFEPRRGVWPTSETDPHDMYGWDYFDYDLCPTEPIFPCQPGQLEEITKDDPEVHIEDTLFNATADRFLMKGRNRIKGGILGGRKHRLFDDGGIGQQQQNNHNKDAVKGNVKALREKAIERFHNHRRDGAKKNS